MKGYEAIFIFHPSLNEEDRMKLTEKVEKTISENGILHETNYWGRKRFAYPIQNFTDGHFYLFVFDGEGKLPHELKRMTTITETILRSMIIVRKSRYQKKEAPVQETKPVAPVEPIKEEVPVAEEIQTEDTNA